MISCPIHRMMKPSFPNTPSGTLAMFSLSLPVQVPVEVEEETRKEAVDRIILEYTRNLNGKLRENMARVPEGVFGKDGFIIRWMGQEITRDDAPSIQRVGNSIKKDMLYYELSL